MPICWHFNHLLPKLLTYFLTWRNSSTITGLSLALAKRSGSGFTGPVTSVATSGHHVPPWSRPCSMALTLEIKNQKHDFDHGGMGQPVEQR
jgi:hypothetical protein